MKRVLAILLLVACVCLADRRGQLMNQRPPSGSGDCLTNALPTGMTFRFIAQTNCYSDTGTTLATNTQRVKQWNDISGNGNHVTNLTGSAIGPTYQTNELNGYAVVRFNATDANSLRHTLVSFGVLTGFTMFVVCRLDTVAPVSGFRMVVSLGVAKHDLAFTGLSPYPTYAHSGGGSVIGSLDARSWGYIETGFNDSGNQIKLIQRDATHTASDAVAWEGSQDLTVGGRPNGRYTFSGDIAEIMFYPYVLTSELECRTVSYLTNQYQIQF